MAKLKVGVLVLPPFSPTSINHIKTFTTGCNVISNYHLGIPHQLLKIVNKDVPKVFNDSTIYVSDKTIDYDMDKKESRYFAYMMELIKHSDRLLIVAPNKVPVLFAMSALTQMSNPTYMRVIVGNQVYDSEQLVNIIHHSDSEKLKSEWNSLTGKSTDVATNNHVYTPDELLVTPIGITLRPYQQQMVDFVLKVKRAGLFVDMGLGKTLATLATIDTLAKKNLIDTSIPILIVAPIMVAVDTWSREAEKWGYDMDVLVNIKLSTKKRRALFDKLCQPQKKLTLVTTNPQQLKSMTEYFHEKHINAPFQVAIVDELSQFKSATAQRFQFISELINRATYFFGLTGTPAPNSLLDIWSQLMVIDSRNGQRFGYNFYEYRNRFFEPDVIAKDGTVYSWKLKHGSEEKIFSLMKQNVISMKSDGLVDLPDLVVDKKYVKLPPKAKKIYDKMDKELRLALIRKKDDDPEVTVEMNNGNMGIANNAVLTTKLLQLASGAIYDDMLLPDSGDDVHYEVFHDEKLKMLKDIIDNANSPVLVFFYFKSELERMKQFINFEYLNPRRKDVKDVIARWNRGEIPVMVAHPASTGHGLNLQDGGHIMVWLTTPWSNEQYRQAVKRLYRSGQKETVSVIHIIAADTDDENVIESINSHEVGQDRLMDALDVAERTG